MKTTLSLLTAIALAVGITGLARAEVTSQNVVGYTQVGVTGGVYQQIGTPFRQIGAPVIDIQDLVIEGAEAGDRILFYRSAVGTGYDIYDYRDMTYDEQWQEAGPGWEDLATGQRAVRAVEPGEGYWYLPQQTKDLLFAGEVVTGQATLDGIGNGVYFIIANPHPTKVNIQEIDFDGIAAGDRMLYYRTAVGTGYDIYDYRDMTYDEQWQEAGPGWEDLATGQRAVRTNQVAEAFWLLAAGEVDVTFPPPVLD